MAELRPMRVGEILDAGLAVYRRHFGLLLQVGLVALWLPVAANVYVQVGGGQLAHPVLYIFANVLQYFGSLVLTASAVRIISDSYLGRAPQLGDAVTFAMSKVWPLFVVAASVLPIVMTPLLACVFTLMYYDLRVRREAFDLEVLGRQLGIG